MIRNKKAFSDHLMGTDVCSFCHEPSNELYGKFFVSLAYRFAVHQHCMLFSAGLPQNGEDNEGFEGFLEKDIVKEIKRAKRLRCCVCHQNGSSAGCCRETCRKSFHFPCGFRQKFLFQYFGEFRAFCFEHRLNQKELRETSHPPKMTKCAICLDDVFCVSSPDTLVTPCCKNTWFHRTCVQEQAKASGYFFRCAVCNDSEKFLGEMKKMGIYVPDRDAAWEEGENFAELLERYSRCDSAHCKCPNGRTFSAEAGVWEMVLCGSCGQYGMHRGCKKWSSQPPLLICPTCQPVHSDSVAGGAATARSLLLSSRSRKITSAKASSKTTKRLRKKRARDECADDSEISLLLNGLKRQAVDDFKGLDLPSETKLLVQRALDAGTAATENSGRRSVCTTTGEKLRAEAGTEMGSLSNHSKNKDDDCFITKYIPGCPICPKCNRRKPMRAPSRVGASESPRQSIGISSPRARSAMTLTGRPLEKVSASTSTFTPLMASQQSMSNPSPFTTKDDDKGFELIEKAAHQVGKSSVFLIPPLKVESEAEANASPPDQKTVGPKRTDKAGMAENVASEPEIRQCSVSCSSYAKKIPEIFLRRLSDTDGESSEPTESLEGAEKKTVVAQERSEDDFIDSEGNREVPECNRNKSKSVAESAGADQTRPDKGRARIDVTSTRKEAADGLSGGGRETSESAGKQSTDSEKASKTSLVICKFDREPDENVASVHIEPEHATDALPTISKASEVVPKHDISTVVDFQAAKRPSGISCVTRSQAGDVVRACNDKVEAFTRKRPANCLMFSRSDPARTVLEAALDHRYELRRSGKEMAHHCLTSF